MCLSTLALLGQVLTEENADELVARAAFRTKEEVDHLVASLRPRQAPREGIRAFPAVEEAGLVRGGREASPEEAASPAVPAGSAGEVDHKEAAARGGPATLDNLRLACRGHNFRHAEETFGAEHMKKYRKGEFTYRW
jgi:hypothetical protein